MDYKDKIDKMIDFMQKDGINFNLICNMTDAEILEADKLSIMDYQQYDDYMYYMARKYNI